LKPVKLADLSNSPLRKSIGLIRSVYPNIIEPSSLLRGPEHFSNNGLKKNFEYIVSRITPVKIILIRGLDLKYQFIEKRHLYTNSFEKLVSWYIGI